MQLSVSIYPFFRYIVYNLGTDILYLHACKVLSKPFMLWVYFVQKLGHSTNENNNHSINSFFFSVSLFPFEILF